MITIYLSKIMGSFFFFLFRTRLYLPDGQVVRGTRVHTGIGLEVTLLSVH